MASNEIKWTGKNLAEVRRFHKDVAHFPRKEGDESYRDASQHPDNLHVTREDGSTLVVALGDTLVRDRQGRLWVQETATERPQATGHTGPGRGVAADGRMSAKTKGGAR